MGIDERGLSDLYFARKQLHDWTDRQSFGERRCWAMLVGDFVDFVIPSPCLNIGKRQATPSCPHHW